MSDYQLKSTEQLINDPRYPFSRGQIRHLLSRRHLNGLQKVIRKIGKRVYFRVDLWEQWIEEQGKERGGK